MQIQIQTLTGPWDLIFGMGMQSFLSCVISGGELLSTTHHLQMEVDTASLHIGAMKSASFESMILVRDGKTQRSVNRILEARERNQVDSNDESMNKEVIPDEEEDVDEEHVID